ncbi:protein of unknown function [Acetoanaerobium sticklandii]|uniref:Uncharacterized protein n=1 Tax=Acetoanaerobium sticklandii (strain ATCC 12662 / DSM 519 / JCM 1433 / CCUG 9281 / NCIMB 10654 / HF) TaxID=499177 RepID=E3PVI8_ACESD|nr:protein of unknown function [Acetoanaerobium sticklandii]
MLIQPICRSFQATGPVTDGTLEISRYRISVGAISQILCDRISQVKKTENMEMLF